MSLRSEVQQTNLERLVVAWRAAAVYTIAAPGPTYTVFTITGGPVEITTLGGVVTGAPNGVPDLAVTVNGVQADNAAPTAIDGAVGTVVYIPLNIAGVIVNAAAIPKTVATLTSMISGIQPLLAPGLIDFTFGTGVSWTGIWFCIYRRLSPASNII